MMDTILNLGLNDQSGRGPGQAQQQSALRLRLLSPLHSDVRHRWCSRFPSTLRGSLRRQEEAEEGQARHRSRRQGAAGSDRGLQEGREEARQARVPAGPARAAGDGARRRVPLLEQRPRQDYRRINNIDDMLGTAVNVQAMVFGNMGETSGTGVGFTRNPATGTKEFYGEFLMNAQGEDVVAGIRTPVHITELEKIMPTLTTSCATSPRAWKSTTATCRTSSSPSRKASSTCCRPATASARAGRRACRHPDGGRRPDHQGRGHLPRRAQPALRLPGAAPG